MTLNSLPQLVIRYEKLSENTRIIKEKLAQLNISLTGVIKGANGLPAVNSAMINGGAESLASSRLNQLRRVKESHPHIHTLALRIPMRSELEELVVSADCSLNSGYDTVKAINEICEDKGINHEVMIMADLGDLREGYFDEEELINVAVAIEKNLDNIVLKGIGTNLGCYGSIVPDQTNLGKLVEMARAIEDKIDRKLEWVSGGASTSLPLVLNQTMPEGINHLRIGNNILLRDIEEYNGYVFEGLHGDALTVRAEVIEVKEKPSHPIGTIGVDAFGNKPDYEDIGIRKRLLLALGRQDVGEMTKLIPLDESLKVIGGSSDHTIVDATDGDKDYAIGDVLEFKLEYESVLFAATSEHVNKVVI